LKNPNASRIVPAMKRTLFLLVLVVLSAVPLIAQESNEFGVIIGGSRRFVDSAQAKSITGAAETDWIESNFAFGNNSIELYWSMPIEPDLNLKFKGGRIQSEIAIPFDADDPATPDKVDITQFRRDIADGQVHHLESVIEYEFDEPFGSSGLFAGLGYYRMSASGEESRSTWGITAGVNSDFPITRRYGVVLEAAYHWVRTDFHPRYLTVGGGVRVSF
jgi:hypothetical protein